MVAHVNPTFFPDRAPDESLYSQCARFHSRAAYNTPDLTGEILFGDPLAGANAQLPFGLDRFTDIFATSLSSPLQLLREQTIAGTYLAFMSASEISEFVTIRSASRASSLDIKRGFFGHKDFLVHPLKYCPQCVEYDIKERGFSYWHTSHQVPGVWICTLHSALLVKHQRTSSERNSWLRPPKVPPKPPRVPTIPNKKTEDLLLKLADAMNWIIKQNDLSAITLKKMLLQSQECSDDLQFQQSLNASHSHFHNILQELKIAELNALSILPKRWFSRHEPPILHPVQWAVAIAHLVPQDAWDDSLRNAISTSPGQLFPQNDSLPTASIDTDDRLNRAVLAMTLNISQTSHLLHKSKYQNLFALSDLPAALALHASSTRETKRYLYRSIVIRHFFSTPLNIGFGNQKEEALSWIQQYDREWFSLTTTDSHKAMTQATLF